jgi:hypothetical protein
MYPRVDSRKFIESLYEEFGSQSPITLTKGKILNHSKSSKVKNNKVKKKVKSSFKDTKKGKVKRK